MNGIIYDVGIGLFSKKKMNFSVYFAILQIVITILQIDYRKEIVYNICQANVSLIISSYGTYQ